MADPRPLTRKELAEFLPNQRAIRAFEKLFDLIPPELLELLALTEEASNDANTALAKSSALFGLLDKQDLRRKNFYFVSKIADLPRPVAGVYTLLDNATYYFTTFVDLQGGRLVGGQNTAIIGSSPENCRVLSTGLASGTALITSEYSLTLQNVSFQAATIFDLDAISNPDQALDWYGINFINCTDVGTIANYNNFIASVMAFLGSSGLVFDGSFGTIAWDATLFASPSTGTGTIITIPASCSVSRRFRVIYSSTVALSTFTAFDVSTSASIPVEGYIFDTCNFSGPGTYTTGVAFDDNKARWIENRGIKNSAALTGYYMTNNATVTTIGAVSTPVKVAGTTTPISISQRFDNTTSNRSTYEGAITRDFRVTAVFSLTSNNNNQVAAYIAKNGTVIAESVSNVTTNAGGRAESASIQAVVELVDTDYIEIWVENNTGANNITVTDLNVITEALN